MTSLPPQDLLHRFTSHIHTLIPPPSEREPYTLASLPRILTNLTLFLFLAYLARRRATYLFRLCLLPFVVYLSLSWPYRYTWVWGPGYEGLNVYDWGQGLLVGVMLAKAIEWALVRDGMKKVGEVRLQAIGESTSSSPSHNGSASNDSAKHGHDPKAHNLKENAAHLQYIPRGIYDALDLAFSLRGISFHFGRKTYIPPPTRPLDSTTRFLLHTLSSFIINFLLVDIFESAIKLIPGVGTSAGGSMFFPHLPLVQRYVVSTAIHTLVGCTLLAGFGMIYDLTTLIAVGLLQSPPQNWPPVLHSPFRTTSLHKLWAQSWQQLLRHTFITYGGVPAYYLFSLGGLFPALGTPASVVGTFLASGLFHEMSIYAMGRGLDWRPVVFFVAQALGLFCERFWRVATGRRVEGVWGRVWVYVWIFGLGQPMIDSWLRRGLGGGLVIPNQLSPVRWTLSYLQQMGYIY